MPILKAARHHGGLFASLLLILFLSGCASAPQTRDILSHTGSNLPRQAELDQVAFFPQQRYQCGPAALATLLDWSGLKISPTQLKSEIYLPERKGSLQVEVLGSARRHGRLAYIIEPQLESLLTEVAAGNPVLVLQNLGLSWAPVWHFAVVVGFKLEQQQIILRSGQTRRRITSLATFERTWARSKYWGLITLQAGQLPAAPRLENYLQASVMLEQTGRWPEAYSAYSSALQQWPGNLIALIGLGNSAYQNNDLAAASSAFRNAIQFHPDAAIAHNNLAQILLEQGKIKEAKRHAQIAIKLGGPELENFRATLADINQKLH